MRPSDTPIDRALRYLEEQAGFTAALNDVVEYSLSWPDRWMTAEEIERELQARYFWSGRRRGVHPRSRAAIVQRWLEREAARCLETGEHGWASFDGQFKYKPGRGHPRSSSSAGSRGPAGRERRREPRTPTELLQCQFGAVANLSMAGALVTTERRPSLQVGARVTLELVWMEEPPVLVRARVIWINQGPEGYQVGLEFRSMTPEQLQQIREVLRKATRALAKV